MNQDPKNLILAIGLSLLVIIGWQYFYAGPQLEKQRQAQSQLQQPAPKPPAGAPTPTPNAAEPGPVPGAAPPPNAGIQPSSLEAIRTRRSVGRLFEPAPSDDEVETVLSASGATNACLRSLHSSYFVLESAMQSS